VLTDEDREVIAEAFASIDKERIRYLKTLTLPERVQLALVMTAVAEQNAARRLRENDPFLGEFEALRRVRSEPDHYLWQRRYKR
jgi:hypothetical protein